MQCLALHAGGSAAAIQRVGHQRMADGGHVHPDLVRAAGVQGAMHPAAQFGLVQACKIGSGRLARMLRRVHHGHAQAVARIAANGCTDRALPFARPGTVRQRHILANHAALRDHAHQRIHGSAAARHDHQAAGVLVQPVHDAGTRHLGSSAIACQQTIEQRAAPVARRRVHHQPCRLVHHQKVGIFVHHLDVHGFRAKRLALQRGLHFHTNLVTCLNAQGRLEHRLAIELHGPLGQQLLQVAARELGHGFCQGTVQALAMLVGAQHQPAQFGLRLCLGTRFVKSVGVCVHACVQIPGFRHRWCRTLWGSSAQREGR